MGDVWNWIVAHGMTLVAIGWGIEKVLEMIAVLTPWKWDDNLGVLLAKVLQNFAPKPAEK